MSKLLCIDDDLDFLDVIKECLMKNKQFQLDFGPSIQIAAMMLQTVKYDVIMFDFQIGKDNGAEYIKKLRNSPGINKDTPVVFVTAY